MKKECSDAWDVVKRRGGKITCRRRVVCVCVAVECRRKGLGNHFFCKYVDFLYLRNGLSLLWRWALWAWIRHRTRTLKCGRKHYEVQSSMMSFQKPDGERKEKKRKKINNRNPMKRGKKSSSSAQPRSRFRGPLSHTSRKGVLAIPRRCKFALKAGGRSSLNLWVTVSRPHSL